MKDAEMIRGVHCRSYGRDLDVEEDVTGAKHYLKVWWLRL